MFRKGFSIPLTLMFKCSCSHKEITCHNIPKPYVNSAEQLSKCFFSALLLKTFTLCELERAPWSFLFSSLHHWTHWRALWRWTHAVQPPQENATGYIWGGTLYRQEVSLKAEVSFWHDETKLTTRYTTSPLSLHIFLCLCIYIV